MNEYVRNGDVNWDTFNSKTYRDRYFVNELEVEDAWLMMSAAQFYEEEGFQTESIEHAVDVGTGPSFVLPLAAIPYAKSMDLLEPGEQNIRYLHDALNNTDTIYRDWRVTSKQLESLDTPVYFNVLGTLMQRAVIRPGRVQDLERNEYDGLTMCFCVESVTQSPEECAELLQTTIASVKKGSPYVAGHIEHSQGYPDYTPEEDGPVNMKKFPGADLDISWYEQQYSGTGIRIIRCPIPSSMRPGYSGTLLAMGIKR
jgi:hypothetical protein